MTLLIGLLCGAALLAPKLAGEPNFAHTHPPGTHHHLHALELIMSSSLPVRPVAVQIAAPRRETVAPLLELWRSVELPRPYQSRAPPAGAVPASRA